MVEMVVQVSEDLAQRLKPMSPWLSVVLELGLIGFKTPAVRTASEIITFLSKGPDPAEVIAYKASKAAQARLRRLLDLNQAGLLSVRDQAELDEIEQIEHVMILLKAKAKKQQLEAAR